MRRAKKRVHLAVAAVTVAGMMLFSAAGSGLGADAPRAAEPRARGAAPSSAVGGLTAKPAVDAAGIAYVVSHILSNPDATTLDREAVTSSLAAVTPKGQRTTVTLSGISSAPAVAGQSLIGTVVLPDVGQYRVVRDLGGARDDTRSVLYRIPLPLSGSARPEAVILEGTFVSPPTVMNGLVYVVTSDAVSLLDGSGPLAEVLGNYTFDRGEGRSFLYVFDTDLALLSKTPLN